MFRTVKELVDIANREAKPIHEIMIEREMNVSGLSREEVISAMAKNLQVMEDAILEGEKGVQSTTGLTGGDAVLMKEYIQKDSFCPEKCF
ncbi:L-serine dehydratase, iron-sulfur-dependent, alpha subunit [Listeria fleischmannii subsp. fleischmannii]|uniref:L-serine dehydratase, iron-sulfur-dependent, alpha subunit n=1 Tax=Listeria fleischmannii subsp. fleischmannii TaxID=1671902 RepID=A0A2X3HIN1_9LIST|nr:L-serine dehydratase, iron-sulfur-dependent, alpha subunit [Listeria fleischmannii subsp. fleischmannii]